MNVPTAHLVHDPVAVAVPVMAPSYPAMQWQSEAASLPGGLTELAGHAVQASVPMALLNVLAGQIWHEVAVASVTVPV